MKHLFTLSTLCMLMCSPLPAEVILDGTLGKNGPLSGPEYQIGADLGQQHGGNLFHSFRDFNLQSHESATFSGPATVQNIISRVTGGNASSIDGTIRSTILNANMYLLNPYGILFGSNAKLDVQGSFHVSTADYLRLQDGGRFDARIPNNSLLTITPIVAFGFLTDAPATIKIQDSHLSVPEGKTFSLIGGELHLAGSQPWTAKKDKYGFYQIKFDAELLAPGGRINLASVASSGEVMPSDMDLNLSGVARRGVIITKNALVETALVETNRVATSEYHNSSSLFIRGGTFELTDSAVDTQIMDEQSGSMIDIQVDTLKLQQGSAISVSTYGTGNAGSLSIKANTIEVSGTHQSKDIFKNYPSNISSASFKSKAVERDAGQAGSISIQADTINLFNGGNISTQTDNAGGGNITITASNMLYLRNGQITTSVSGGKGNGGNIIIEHPEFVVLDKGKIKAQADEGHGGNIHIVAEQFIATPNSLVSASSKKGISGNVMISSPESDISSMLVVLPNSFMDATHLLVQCRHTIEDMIDNPERFTVLNYRGRPPEPEDWQ